MGKNRDPRPRPANQHPLNMPETAREAAVKKQRQRVADGVCRMGCGRPVTPPRKDCHECVDARQQAKQRKAFGLA